MIKILTHRGLDPDLQDFFSESSIEAFQNHLCRGYGLEFDIAFLSDGEIAVIHDLTLNRITDGRDTRLIGKLNAREISSVPLNTGRIPLLSEVLDLIRNSNVTISALHFKGKFQTDAQIDLLVNYLKHFNDLSKRLMIFDLLPQTIHQMRAHQCNFMLAPSVARHYDICRYNSSVSGTLLSVDEALAMKSDIDWVWLDEWDVSSKTGAREEFYCTEIFNGFRASGLKIALVTPELHSSSPGLLGAEAHQDGVNREKLGNRINRILSLRPDAICTDHPDWVGRLMT